MSIFGNRLKYVSSKIWDTTKPDSSLHSRFRRQGRGAAPGEGYQLIKDRCLPSGDWRGPLGNVFIFRRA